MPHNKEIEEVDKILKGIDKDGSDDEAWWETSSGAEFGEKKKQEIKDFLTAYGKSQYDKGVEEELNKVAIKVAEYIKWNWNASLGYGDDTKIIERALDDINWILAVIPKETILKAIEDNK